MVPALTLTISPFAWVCSPHLFNRTKLERFNSAKHEASSPVVTMRAPNQLDQRQTKLDDMVAAFICGDWPAYRDAVDWLRDYVDSEKDRKWGAPRLLGVAGMRLR